MKNLILTVMMLSTFGILGAQNLTDLMTQQAEKQGVIADLQAQIDAAQGEVNALQKEIDKLSGWRKGVNGIIGFDWNKSNGWVASPNPEAKSAALNLDITGYLLRDAEKTFWHNKANLVKAWNDVDLAIDDEKGLFENGTTDILNISSLAGYKISDKLAISGQGELNTSLSNFLKPGTFDLGVGVTWLPIENMTVMIHPLNYNIAFPADGLDDAIKATPSLGAKFRVDYFQDFVILSKDVHWNTSLTGYLPYTSKDPITLADMSIFEPKVSNFTWLNSFSFEVWKGIGVGLGWGLRKAQFESEDLQYYTNAGLSYKI